MKITKTTYWITTGIVAMMMLHSADAYLTQPALDQAFQHLGFPAYFRIELAIAKLIGTVLLLAPVAAKLKEWAYAGFTFCFVSAFIAHTCSGDPVNYRMMPLIFLVLLAISYITYYKRNKVTQNERSVRQAI